MLPDTTKTSPDGRFLNSAALVVAEAIQPEQGAYLAGCSVAELIEALGDPDIAEAVDAEVVRLRYSGDLANLKAAKLTDAMLDKLLATPSDEISTGLAMKLAELGLKFREKSAPEAKLQATKTRTFILTGNDPDPPEDPEATLTYIIDLRDKHPARVIDHKGVTDAE